MKAPVQAQAGSEDSTPSTPASKGAIRDASSGLQSVATQTVDAMNEVMNVAVVCQQVLRTSVHLSLLARDTTTTPLALDSIAETLHANAHQGLAALRRVSNHSRELLASVEQTHASIVVHTKGLTDEVSALQRERETLLAERAATSRLVARMAAHARNIRGVLDEAWPREPGATR